MFRLWGFEKVSERAVGIEYSLGYRVTLTRDVVPCDREGQQRSSSNEEAEELEIHLVPDASRRELERRGGGGGGGRKGE